MRTTQHTAGLIHHNEPNSRHGHQLVYASDGHLLADVGAYNRSAREDLANAARVVACWNACEGIADPAEMRRAWQSIVGYVYGTLPMGEHREALRKIIREADMATG